MDAQPISDVERRVAAEADRCTQALKLTVGSELRFVSDLSNAVELAAFLLELDTRCAEVGVRVAIAFILQPSLVGPVQTADSAAELTRTH